MGKEIKRLKALREAKFLSQAELAEKAGVCQPTVSAAESGAKISLGSIKKIARALRIAPEKLL